MSSELPTSTSPPAIKDSATETNQEKSEEDHDSLDGRQDLSMVATQVVREPVNRSDAPSISQCTSNASQSNHDLLLAKYKRDLESMVIKYARSESENLQNKNKVDDLEKKLKRAFKDNESLANRIRILTNDKNSITDTLNAKLAQLTVLEQKNNSLSSSQTSKLKDLENRCDLLEKANEELLKQIDTYKNKEGELLDFSERLSMKQMLLQTELDKALEKPPDYNTQYEQMRKENEQLSEQYKDCVDKIKELEIALKSEKETNDRLNAKLVELELGYRRRMDELENEMKVMRRKHSIAAKEIYKQMKQMNETTSSTQQQKQQKIKS